MPININEINKWSRMGPRAMFGQFMMDIAKKIDNLIVISADLGRSSGLDRFKSTYPKKYLSVGICEQNLIGVASGLAKEGFKVFVTSFAPFLSMRASEQIRMNLGYMKLPVNIVALGSGLSMGFLGNSHYGLEDVATMNTVPGLKIFSPADCLELNKIIDHLSCNHNGPTYTRLTGIPGSLKVYNQDYKFKFGSPSVLSNGDDLLILGSGSVMGQVKKAEKYLKDKNISPCIINLHLLKPFNTKKISKYVLKYDKIVLIDEHSVVGGLGNIFLQNFHQNINKKKILNICLKDQFGPTGDYKYLLNYHGLSAEKIFKKIFNFFKK